MKYILVMNNHKPEEQTEKKQKMHSKKPHINAIIKKKALKQSQGLIGRSGKFPNGGVFQDKEIATHSHKFARSFAHFLHFLIHFIFP